MKRVAIKGGLGAYHGIAAESFFAGERSGNYTCVTFSPIFSQHQKRLQTSLALWLSRIPLPEVFCKTTNLLKEHKLHIAGRYKLRISTLFAALPGQTIHDIKKSNRIRFALMQCG